MKKKPIYQQEPTQEEIDAAQMKKKELLAKILPASPIQPNLQEPGFGGRSGFNADIQQIDTKTEPTTTQQINEPTTAKTFEELVDEFTPRMKSPDILTPEQSKSLRNAAKVQGYTNALSVLSQAIGANSGASVPRMRLNNMSAEEMRRYERMQIGQDARDRANVIQEAIRQLAEKDRQTYSEGMIVDQEARMEQRRINNEQDQIDLPVKQKKALDKYYKETYGKTFDEYQMEQYEKKIKGQTAEENARVSHRELQQSIYPNAVSPRTEKKDRSNLERVFVDGKTIDVDKAEYQSMVDQVTLELIKKSGDPSYKPSESEVRLIVGKLLSTTTPEQPGQVGEDYWNDVQVESNEGDFWK